MEPDPSASTIATDPALVASGGTPSPSGGDPLPSADPPPSRSEARAPSGLPRAGGGAADAGRAGSPGDGPRGDAVPAPARGAPAEDGPRLRIGVSSCLLGNRVRYDGGHKHDPYVTQTLGAWVEYVPVCPEVEAGFGLPRPTLHLKGAPDAPRLVFTDSGEDVTERMLTWSARRVRELQALDLDGYILKNRSPSCGMERVKVFAAKGLQSGTARGTFASVLLEAMPLLPVEEEGRLQDDRLRENFVERIFALHRWKAFLRTAPGPAQLVAFHTRQKMTLLSHGRLAYEELGRLVASAGSAKTSRGDAVGVASVFDAYGRAYMAALRHPATRGRRADVLHHLAGHYKRVLPADDRAELSARIDEYRRGLVPLIVPMTLLTHHLRHHPDPWVAGQDFLDPYPAELMLRNHV